MEEKKKRNISLNLHHFQTGAFGAGWIHWDDTGHSSMCLTTIQVKQTLQNSAFMQFSLIPVRSQQNNPIVYIVYS